MKKLITMGFLALGTLSMFANGPLEKKEDQILWGFKCYKFEVYRVQLVNHNPTNYRTSYIEYGRYTQAGADQRADELYQLYPTDIDRNGNGVRSLHGYGPSDESDCLKSGPATHSEK